MRNNTGSVLWLALIFVGLAGAGKKRDDSSSGDDNDSGGGSASTSKRTAPAAANATRADARRAAAPVSSEEAARRQAATNATIKEALRDGLIEIDASHEATKQQEAELRTTGHALPVPDPHPGDQAGPSPTPPPGGGTKPDQSILQPPASDASKTLQPPLTATLPSGRSPKTAALQLLAWLKATRRFGGGSDRPNEIKDAQTDLGVKPDGIVGPKTRAAAAAVGVDLPRSPRDAAIELKTFLVQTKRFGSATDHPLEVKAAQSDLGVEPDGIVGPKTRAAAKKAGVTLPTK